MRGTKMEVRVHTPDDALAGQVEQMLRFYLTGLDGQIDELFVRVESTRDTLGAPLVQCQVIASAGRGGELVIEETQSDLVRALTRALDRCVRTLRRRSATGRLGHLA
jgi:hypothetical protein